MKKLIENLSRDTQETIKVMAALLLLNGCASFQNIQWSDATITASVSFGTTEGLKLAIKDSVKRTLIANNIMVYATALRSITEVPTPDALIATINQFVPANIRQNYPELQAIVFPVITAIYGQYYAQFAGDHAKIYKVISDIAAGLEKGAQPYISHGQIVRQ